MKDDPILIRKLPPTALIRHAVETWPHKPDPEAVVYRQMTPGCIAVVRTRWGTRWWRIRVVHMAKRGRNRGRRYFVGDSRRGWCHTAWLDHVIRIEHPHRKELTP